MKKQNKIKKVVKRVAQVGVGASLFGMVLEIGASNPVNILQQIFLATEVIYFTLFAILCALVAIYCKEMN